MTSTLFPFLVTCQRDSSLVFNANLLVFSWMFYASYSIQRFIRQEFSKNQELIKNFQKVGEANFFEKKKGKKLLESYLRIAIVMIKMS